MNGARTLSSCSRLKRWAPHISKPVSYTHLIEDCDVHYSVEETPYGKDIVRELCDSARRHGIKIDLYFSHPDWYDADFRPFMYHPMLTPDADELVFPEELERFELEHGAQRDLFPPADEAARKRMMARHRAQLLELVQNLSLIHIYDPRIRHTAV